MTRLETLTASRDAAVTSLRTLLDSQAEALSTRSLTSEETDAAVAGEARLAQLDTAITAAVADEARTVAFDAARSRLAPLANASGASTATYGPNHPRRSFYRDLVSLSDNGPNAWEARDRLVANNGEQEALAAGPMDTRAARYAAKAVMEGRRASQGETRDINTGLPSGGAWLPPFFDLDETATWRTFSGRALISQLRDLPLPEFGMTVSIPKVTSPTSATEQNLNTPVNGSTENTFSAVTDLTGTWITQPICTFVSTSLASQQWLDRFGPAGFAADQLIFNDQEDQVNKLLDTYAAAQIINAAVAAGNTIAYNDTSFLAYKWLQAVRTAIANLETTDGVVTTADHVYVTPAIAQSVLGAYDSANRPLVVPSAWGAYNPLLGGTPVAKPEGFTGVELAGGVPLWKDQNLLAPYSASAATPGSDHPTLVGDFKRGAIWSQGVPVVRTVVQPGYQSLTVGLQTYVYGICIPNRYNSFFVVGGTGTQAAYLL